MSFNANAIYGASIVKISGAIGTPASAEAFHSTYIQPLLESMARETEGIAIDEAFDAVVADYQRESFIVGFNSAVQLLMDCMGGVTANE